MGSLPISDVGVAATEWINKVMMILKEQGFESGLRAYLGQQSVKKKNVVEFKLKSLQTKMRSYSASVKNSGSVITPVESKKIKITFA